MKVSSARCLLSTGVTLLNPQVGELNSCFIQVPTPAELMPQHCILFLILLSLTSGRVKDGWRRIQTVNYCNFNSVKEAYLNDYDFLLMWPWSSLQYTVYGSSGQQTSLSLFCSRTREKKSYFLRESLRTVTSTLLCSQCAEAEPLPSNSGWLRSSILKHLPQPQTWCDSRSLKSYTCFSNSCGLLPRQEAVISMAVCTSHNFLKHHEKYSDNK